MKNKKILYALTTLTILALYIRYCYDVSSVEGRFQEVIDKANLHCEIIASNRQFKECLALNATLSAEQFIEDMVNNQYDFAIKGFFVVDRKKNITVTSFRDGTDLTHSILLASLSSVLDVGKDHIGEKYIFIPQPVYNTSVFVVAALEIKNLKERFFLKKLKIAQGEIQSDGFHSLKIIYEDASTYLLIFLLGLSIVLILVFSEKRIERELSLSHLWTRHEFSSILDNVDATIAMIPDAFDSNDKARMLELIEDASVQTSWMNKLSSQLGYLIAKIELEPVKLKSVFGRFSRETGIFYNRSVLTLNLDIPDDLEVMANKNVLNLILINLIKNCAYHKDPKTKDVFIRAYAVCTDVYIEIKNKGNIPNHLLKGVFRPGAKGNQSKGMGLGLFNSKRQADQMGGDLNILSDFQKNEVVVTLKLKMRNS